ncbi:hypothetical protein NB703_001063 [Pantoea ananatis]|uniref:Uncharacterized protein n=1 Tax=Pantoea ananas TaxID=553 RepID=A0AAJ1CWR9_PANAN|nr:hypothetical protein [Pantoea ananatis]
MKFKFHLWLFQIKNEINVTHLKNIRQGMSVKAL